MRDKKTILLIKKTHFIYLLFLALIALAEILTVYSNTQLGMVLHSFIFVFLLIYYSYIPIHSFTNQLKSSLLALALVPLIRIISLSMPLFNFELTYWFLIIGIPLFISSFFVIRILNLKSNDIGLSWKNLGLNLIVSSSGLIFGYVEYLILKPEPLISTLNLNEAIIPGLIILIFTGFLEELIFRGIIQNVAEKVFQNIAIIYTAALYAILHIGNLSLLLIIFTFVVGIAFGLVVKKTGSILGVALSHGIINILLYLIFPFILE